MLSNLTPLMMWAATYFLHSTLLLGGVWLWFRWREPSSHALREAVWKLAAVGGFVTASLQLGLQVESPVNGLLRTAWTAKREVPISVHSDLQHPVPMTVRTDGHDAVQNQLGMRAELIGSELIDPELHALVVLLPDGSAMAVENSDTPQADSAVTNSNVTLQPTLEPGFREYAPTPATLMGILAALCGAVIALSGWGLWQLCFEQFRFRRRLAGCLVTSQGIGRFVLDELLTTAHIRQSVELLVSEDELEPGACGWLRWRIVVPARALQELSREELRALLAHELAHLVRGDQWWLLVGQLLAVCFGWQPLNRVASREWQRASEYLCDAWAIQRNVERLSLARCLTTVAEWRLSGLATLAGFGSGNRSNLSQRVERLVEDVSLADPWQRYSRRHLLVAVGSLILVGMVGLAPAATWPVPSLPVAKPFVGQATDITFISSVERSDDDVELVADDIDAPVNVRTRLIPIQIETIPDTGIPDVVVGIEVFHEIRRQLSTDMVELIAELDALERAISQVPQTSSEIVWQSQLQRYRQRLQKIQRLSDDMLIPM